MNNWPLRSWDKGEPDQYDQRWVNNNVYRQCLSYLATEIANLRLGTYDPRPSMYYTPITGDREPRLRIISFGLKEELLNKRNMGFRLDPMLFVKSRIQIMGGEVKWTMESVTRQSLDRHYMNDRKSHLIDRMIRDVGEFESGVVPGVDPDEP
ncbi:MAG: hypothetical protein Q9182_005871 [Xanthomendoza sp. 2 TL-2023]